MFRLRKFALFLYLHLRRLYSVLVPLLRFRRATLHLRPLPRNKQQQADHLARRGDRICPNCYSTALNAWNSRSKRNQRPTAPSFETQAPVRLAVALGVQSYRVSQRRIVDAAAPMTSIVSSAAEPRRLESQAWDAMIIIQRRMWKQPRERHGGLLMEGWSGACQAHPVGWIVGLGDGGGSSLR